VTPELDAIVLKALERDPAQRFDSARGFALALENAVPGATATVVAATLAATCGDRALQRTGTFAALRAGIASCDEPEAEDTSGHADTQSLLRAARVPQPLCATSAAAGAGQPALCTGPLTVFVCKEETTRVKPLQRSRARALLSLAVLAVSLLMGGRWVSSRDASIGPTQSAAAPRVQAAPPPPRMPSAPASPTNPGLAAQNDTRPAVAEPPRAAVRIPNASERSLTARAESAKRRPSNAARPANCSPPSYLDAQGIRHFKPECL
jgi:hypothetical protein